MRSFAGRVLALSLPVLLTLSACSPIRTTARGSVSSIPIVLIAWGPNASGLIPDSVRGYMMHWNPLTDMIQADSEPVLTIRRANSGGYVRWAWDGRSLTAARSGPVEVEQSPESDNQYRLRVFELENELCYFNSLTRACSVGNSLVLGRWRSEAVQEVSYPRWLTKTGFVTPLDLEPQPKGHLKVLVQYLRSTRSGAVACDFALSDVGGHATTWERLPLPQGSTCNLQLPQATYIGDTMYIAGLDGMSVLDVKNYRLKPYKPIASFANAIGHPLSNPVAPWSIALGTWNRVLLVGYGNVILAIRGDELLGFLTIDGTDRTVIATTRGRTNRVSIAGLSPSFSSVLPREH